MLSTELQQSLQQSLACSFGSTHEVRVDCQPHLGQVCQNDKESFWIKPKSTQVMSGNAGSYVHMCSHVGTYVHVCSHAGTYVHVYSHAETYVHVCSNARTYAQMYSHYPLAEILYLFKLWWCVHISRTCGIFTTWLNILIYWLFQDTIHFKFH